MAQPLNGSKPEALEPEAPQTPDTQTPKQKRANLIENVKLLALEHGIPKAAKIAGLSVYTVHSWKRRYNWQIAHAHNPVLHKAHTIDKRPADILQNLLTSNKSRSSLALSSYLASTSEHLQSKSSAQKLGLTRRAKDLGDLHARLYPPENSQAQILNVAIVTGQRTILPAD